MQGKFAELDGVVQLYSSEGRSYGKKFCRKIVPPLNARELAAVMLRQMSRAKNNSFSRKLVYPKGF